MNIRKILAVAVLAVSSLSAFAGERVKMYDEAFLPAGCKPQGKNCFNPNNKMGNELFAQGRFEELSAICNDIGYFHVPQVSRGLVEQCAKMGSRRMMGFLAFIYRHEGNYDKMVDWAEAAKNMPSPERYSNGAIAPNKDSRMAWGELCYARLYAVGGVEKNAARALWLCDTASSKYQDSTGVSPSERYDDITLVWYKKALEEYNAEAAQRQKEIEEYDNERRIHRILENNAEMYHMFGK